LEYIKENKYMAVTIQRLAVPAFFGVAPQGASSDWTKIEQAGQTVGIVVAGLDTLQSRGATIQDVQNQFSRCQGQQQKVLGYVNTQFGTRPFTGAGSIFENIQQWYTTYPQIDGVFFDNGPSFDPGQRPTFIPLPELDQFYQRCYRDLLHNRFKAEHPDHNTMFLNASQFPNDWVLQATDYIITWEQKKDFYSDPNDPNRFYQAEGLDGNLIGIPGWWTASQNTDRIAHTVFKVCPPDPTTGQPSGPVCPDLPPILDLSRNRNAGNVYIYDKDAFYDRLPPYWQQEVDTVRGNNRTQISALLDQDQEERRDMDRPEFCSDECDGEINCIKACRQGLPQRKQALDAEIALLQAELRIWS
jgi:Spherulation-specific family 4